MVVAPKRWAAKVLLPEPVGPHSTRRVRRGTSITIGIRFVPGEYTWYPQGAPLLCYGCIPSLVHSSGAPCGYQARKPYAFVPLPLRYSLSFDIIALHKDMLCRMGCNESRLEHNHTTSSRHQS